MVDLPLDVEGFVPASHLLRTGRPIDAYQVGDELELQVIRMDREDRELVLSETAKARAEERAERDAEFREQRNQQREERKQVESLRHRPSRVRRRWVSSLGSRRFAPRWRTPRPTRCLTRPPTSRR